MINKKSKILNITHGDLDGCVSSILLANVFENITIADKQFYDIDEYMKTVNYDKYDYVILTDIHPEDESLINTSDNIILLDHHESSIKLHNPEKLHLVIPKYCGAAVTKNFIEKSLKISLNGKFDELVMYTNDYDMWIKKYPKSEHLNMLYNKYFSQRFRLEFMSGRTEFTESEMKYIKTMEKRKQETINSLEVFDLDLINGCVIKVTEFINECASYLLLEKNYQVVIVYNPRKHSVSFRCENEGDLHLGNLLKKMGWGGGHKKAAGMSIKGADELQTKISCVEQEMYENFPSIRK